MDTGIDFNTHTYYETIESGEQMNTQELLSGLLEKKEKLIQGGIITFLTDYGKPKELLENSSYGFYGNLGIIIYPDGNKGNTFKYSKENNLEFMGSLTGLMVNDNVESHALEAGYIIENGRLFSKGNEVTRFLDNGNINSSFVKAIGDIHFYQDMWEYFGMMKTITKGKKLEGGINHINRAIVTGSIRIKEIMYFKQHGYISDEEFPKLLVRAIQELPNQCSDTRFYQNAKGEKMGMEVRKEELDEYLNPTEGEPLITQKVYDECIKLIEKRDELIRKKEEAKESTKGSLEVEKTRKGIVDRIGSLLGWE